METGTCSIFSVRWRVYIRLSDPVQFWSGHDLHAPPPSTLRHKTATVVRQGENSSCLAVVCHFEELSDEQSDSIDVLHTILCLPNQLAQLFVYFAPFFSVFMQQRRQSPRESVVVCFFFRPAERHFCLLAVMNLVPNERQQRSS